MELQNDAQLMYLQQIRMNAPFVNDRTVPRAAVTLSALFEV
jgi:hypothetical protein